MHSEEAALFGLQHFRKMTELKPQHNCARSSDPSATTKDARSQLGLWQTSVCGHVLTEDHLTRKELFINLLFKVWKLLFFFFEGRFI